MTETELAEKRKQLIAEKIRLEEELTVKTQAILDMPQKVTRDTGLVVAIPNYVVKATVFQTLTEAFNGLSVGVNNLHVDVQDDVKAKILVADLVLGDFKLDMLLKHVRAVVRTGRPNIIVGGGQVQVAVPLSVIDGEGNARLHFTWAGRGPMKPVCGELSVIREVGGVLAPFSVDFKGQATIYVQNSNFIFKPEIDPPSFRLVIQPNQASWAAVQEVLNSQSGICRFALKKFNAIERLRELLNRGIQVTIKTDKLKTFRIPFDVDEYLDFHNQRFRIKSSPALLQIGRDYLWLGFDFDASRA